MTELSLLTAGRALPGDRGGGKAQRRGGAPAVAPQVVSAPLRGKRPRSRASRTFFHLPMHSRGLECVSPLPLAICLSLAVRRPSLTFFYCLSFTVRRLSLRPLTALPCPFAAALHSAALFAGGQPAHGLPRRQPRRHHRAGRTRPGGGERVCTLSSHLSLCERLCCACQCAGAPCVRVCPAAVPTRMSFMRGVCVSMVVACLYLFSG